MKRNRIQLTSVLLSVMLTAVPVFAEASGVVFEDSAAAAETYSSEEVVVFGDSFIAEEEEVFGDSYAADEAIDPEKDVQEETDPVSIEEETVVPGGGAEAASTADMLNAAKYPESPHDYANNMDQCWTYTDAGAVKLSITFSKKTEVEESWDKIYIYQGSDSNGKLIGQYTGTELAGEKIKVAGDTVCIRLTSDDDVTKYGFSIDSIVPEYGMVSSGTCGTNVKYELNTKGVLRIYESGDMMDYTQNEKNRAPWYGMKISSVVIEDGVSSIGDFAFDSCSNLKSIKIPGSVSSIGSSAFHNCSGLSSVVLTTGLTGIGSHAFENCKKLSSLEIPNGVTGIGESAFAGCSGLTGIKIPDSVKSIGESAFAGCSSLTGIKIPNSVTGIAKNTFKDCSGLTSVQIPNSVKSIGESAYMNCRSLSSVQIPNSVTEIGRYAFSGCSSLGSIILPNRVTILGESAFDGCSSLIRYDEKSDGTLALYRCYNTGIISYEIPEEIDGKIVTSIEDNAFIGCSKLADLKVPQTITSIGENIFDENVSIADADGFEIIGNVLYRYIGSAQDVTIPASVEIIYPNAFMDNEKLVSVSIPNSVRSIGKAAFYNCKSLTKVTIPSDVQRIEAETFYGCSSLIKVTIKGNLVSVGDCAFYECDRLSSLALPDSVTNIGEKAFYGSGMKTLVLPSNLYTIGEYAFAGCEITEATIPNSVSAIRAYAFYNCSGLEKVTIPNSVSNIEEFAFDKCLNLKKIEIPDSVTQIGYCALPIGTTIIGGTGSQAEKYAEANDNPFIARITVVSGLKVTPTNLNEVTVTWDKTAGATKYKLQYSASSNFSKPTSVVISAKSALSKTIKIENAGRYYFRIRAIQTVDSSTMKSNWTKVKASVLGEPGAIKGLKAEALGSGEVQLSWTQQSGVTAYRVFTSTSSFFLDAATVKKDYTTNSVKLTNQVVGKMYYKVRAVTKIGSKIYLGKAVTITATVK